MKFSTGIKSALWGYLHLYSQVAFMDSLSLINMISNRRLCFWCSMHVTHPPQIDYVIPSQPSSCTTRLGLGRRNCNTLPLVPPLGATLGYALANSINSATRTHTNALNTPLVTEKRAPNWSYTQICLTSSIPEIQLTHGICNKQKKNNINIKLLSEKESRL